MSRRAGDAVSGDRAGEPAPSARPAGETSEDAGSGPEASAASLMAYGLLGVFFGIVLTKSEVISWFRIQEMFRFQSFHMYGILGSAVLVAGVSTAILRRFASPGWAAARLEIPEKELGSRNYRYWIGGTLFGLGWALLGACPGPIFVLVGNGVTVYVAALASALAGTWAYGRLRPHLPHY